MGTYYTRGIILAHQNWREADRLVSIYTNDRGKISVVARGSRKIKSKLAGNLEPLSEASFMLAKGKQFDTVAAVEITEIFKSIKENFVKVNLANYFSTLVLKTTFDHKHDPGIFNLLKEVFNHLNNIDLTKKNKNILLWYFVWRYLAQYGFQIDLYKCQSCHKKIKQEKNYINFKKGGLICQRCHSKNSGDLLISNNSIKILRLISEGNFSKILVLKLNSVIISELNYLTGQIVNYFQERDLKPDKFLIN